jgi:hypothetical protein
LAENFLSENFLSENFLSENFLAEMDIHKIDPWRWLKSERKSVSGLKAGEGRWPCRPT